MTPLTLTDIACGVLFGTFVTIRILVLLFKHTPTKFLRDKYQWDIHHLHLGIVIAVGAFMASLDGGWTNLLVILSSVGFALILDEFFSFIFSVNYSTKKEFVPALILCTLPFMIVLINYFIS